MQAQIISNSNEVIINTLWSLIKFLFYLLNEGHTQCVQSYPDQAVKISIHRQIYKKNNYLTIINKIVLHTYSKRCTYSIYNYKILRKKKHMEGIESTYNKTVKSQNQIQCSKSIDKFEIITDLGSYDRFSESRKPENLISWVYKLLMFLGFRLA